jgi:outer membrane cobalamin receptor
MKFIFTYLLIFFSTFYGFSQELIIKGFVKDSFTNEPLIGVTIKLNQSEGTRTNQNGIFAINTKVKENLTLQCSYAGYESSILSFSNPLLSSMLAIEISMIRKTNSLNQITISGSRFEKRLGEEIVSMEVLKPSQVLNAGNNSMDDALNRVAGVDVIENQVNIRGGAGWSYGAGSRVLVLVDDMPMLTGDAADAKFDFLPLENCEQIEIIKGASSSLYGSSALNGVVNFRTGFAKSKPKTKIMIYNGMFGNFKNKDWSWWDKKQPNFQGGYFSHAQKFGQLDLVIGSAWFSEDSYLQGDLSRRIRLNSNLRYRSKKIDGLILGLNMNGHLNKSQTFFFWQPDNSGKSFLKPYGGLDDTTTTINKNQGQRFNIDAYLQYMTKQGTKHILRSRWFRSRNNIPEKKQSSIADVFFGEYQCVKSFQKVNVLLQNLRLVGGVTSTFGNVIGELYGNHKNINLAPYLQIEEKIRKLWLSAGIRYELNKLDKLNAEIKPVVRFGANYELAKATFLRASYGEGYRYPSIAERFIKTSFGASKVFPNTYLKSETGWSSELGIKQGFKLGSWQGMLDLATFWTEYQDMMEFNFGLHLPSDSNISQVANPLDYLGFKSINVGKARINGIDFSITAQGKIKHIDASIMLGYTYMNPRQINPDSVIMANISGTTNTLKYRYRHSLKFDHAYSYKKITLGSTLLYTSFMQNIDAVFENTKPDVNIYGSVFEYGTKLPGTIHQFRNKYNQGSLVIDLRSSFQFSKQCKLAFIVKNVLNTVYAERPALISPPRNFTLQLGVEL